MPIYAYCNFDLMRAEPEWIDMKTQAIQHRYCPIHSDELIVDMPYIGLNSDGKPLSGANANGWMRDIDTYYDQALR